MGIDVENPIKSRHQEDEDFEAVEKTMELGGIQVDKNKYPALQRNAAQVKGNHRILPKPIIVKVLVNDHPA